MYDFKVCNKGPCRSANQLHFRISQCKRIFLRRSLSGNSNVLARGEYYYGFESGDYKSMFAKKFNATDYNVIQVPEANQVKPDKIKDVVNLLEKHFGEDWASLESLRFYRHVICIENDVEMNEDEPNEAEEEICEPRDSDFVEQLIV